jgi:hypothetical protein
MLLVRRLSEDRAGLIEPGGVGSRAPGGSPGAGTGGGVEISLMERELQLLRTRLNLLSSRMASLKGKENEEPKKEDLTS